MKKRLFAVITALCLLVTIGTPFALAVQAGEEPPTGEIQTTDEPQAGDTPVEVSTYYELLQAYQVSVEESPARQLVTLILKLSS